MNPIQALAVVAALVAVATVVGLAWRSRQGRVRRTDGTTVVRLRDVPGVRRFGGGATLVQFSTELCSPCRSTRTVLERIAAERPSVSHIDLDLTHRPDLANRFSISQTPTTLILDRKGVVRARIGGAPRVTELVDELDRILIST